MNYEPCAPTLTETEMIRQLKGYLEATHPWKKVCEIQIHWLFLSVECNRKEFRVCLRMSANGNPIVFDCPDAETAAKKYLRLREGRFECAK